MHTATQAAPRRSGNPAWIKGVSGNPKSSITTAERRARIAAKVDAWVAELGGPVGSAEREMLWRAAELSMLHPRRNEDMVRTTNAIGRLLAQAGFHRHRHRKPEPSLVARMVVEGEPHGPAG